MYTTPLNGLEVNKDAIKSEPTPKFSKEFEGPCCRDFVAAVKWRGGALNISFDFFSLLFVHKLLFIVSLYKIKKTVV